jgi:protein-tyrosine-phosphatase
MKVLIVAALAWTAALAQAPPRKVVFVCEHGAAKSVIAAEEFKRMAREKGLVFDVLSRGTAPDAEIAPGVRQGLHADGMDVGGQKPAKVSAKDLAGAVRVVSFGPDLSAMMPEGAKVSDWSATPPPSKDYRAARDDIRARLTALLQEMSRR